MSRSYYVYMLGCSDHSFYIGSTTDLNRRINERNTSKKGARYTKIRRPVVLIYTEKVTNRSEALKRELALKKLSRHEKEQLVRK